MGLPVLSGGERAKGNLSINAHSNPFSNGFKFGNRGGGEKLVS